MRTIGSLVMCEKVYNLKKYILGVIIMEETGRCILQVDTEPMLHGYFHSACMFCISAPKVKFNGVNGEIENLFFERGKNISTDYLLDEGFSIGDNEVVTSLSGYDENHVKMQKTIYSKDACFLYNYAQEPIACSVKVNSFRWSNTWSFAGIRIIQGDDKGINFRIGFAADDKIAVIKNFTDHEDAKLYNNSEKYCYIRVKIDEDKIWCYMSVNGTDWIEYLVVDNFVPPENRKIGFFLWTDDDNFKNWFYTNYIQLHAGPELEAIYDVKLDYYTGIKMWDRYNIQNPWIKQFIISSAMMKQFHDIFDFIIKCIDNGHYIGLMLNEKYVPSSVAYDVFDFEHQSLIYGYDLNKKIIYLMGFDRYQHFKPYVLTFEEFYAAYDNLINSYEIALMSFSASEYVYDLDVKIVCKMLREYRFSIDSSYREELNVNKGLRFYGIQIYDILLNNLYKLSDQRISYIIYEHKKIMVARIDYFKCKGLFQNTDYIRLHHKSKELEKISLELMMICIKYQISGKEELLNKIEALIKCMKEKDINFIDDFIQTLEIIEKETVN